jgi:NADH dehydrogenase [ubiquinone] 1 alpha subcomplex assembly factor 7
MSATVRAAVVAAIRDHGPIGFAEYMELALYGDDGYYLDAPVGPRGDFVTSPHVHPVFGRLLAEALRELREELGRPDPLRVTEVGAGDGTLAAQLLEAFARTEIEATYVAVERSPGALGALGRMPGVLTRASMPDGPHVVLAHELLDNLPFRRVRMARSGPVEIRVGLEGERFVEVETPAPADDPAFDGAVRSLSVGEEAVVPDGAFAFVDEIASVLRRGYALVIDYTTSVPGVVSVHSYRAHREVHDPLEDPGDVDVTAGVDFSAVARRAEERGLVALGSITQRAALTVLGFEDQMREELERQHRHLDAREGLEAVRTWSGRSRAGMLVDPSGLGAFEWLLLATPGLAAPPWLGDRVP